MEIQFSKWDAADEMRRAANGMESEAQEDLRSLVDKMRKQISLYQMGGDKYTAKRYDMMGNLISLLYRLRPISGNYYDELLGKLIVEKANLYKSPDRISAYREAALLPSVAGLRALAKRYQLMPPTKERIDTIRTMYNKAIELLSNDEDSLRSQIQTDLVHIPEGFYHHSDGTSYPYRLVSDDEAILTGMGPWFATHIEGYVELPSFIDVAGLTFTIVGLDDFAFGRNKKLNKIKLPQYCRYIGVDAFKGCDTITLIINPNLEKIISSGVSETISKNTTFIIPEIPQNIDWINDIIENVEFSKSEHNFRELTLAHARYYEKNGDFEKALPDYERLIVLYVNDNNLDKAKELADAVSRINAYLGNYYLSVIYDAQGDYKYALKCAVKGQTDKYPFTYNRLAYLLSNEKYGNTDFSKAHKVIDKAIKLADNDLWKADFIDTKGEIYLMENKTDKAKEFLDLALSVYPDYFLFGESKLYAYFFPDIQISASKKAEDEIPKQENPDYSQRIRNISIALLAQDFLYPRFDMLAENCNGIIDNALMYISGLKSDSDEFRLDAINLFYMFLNRVASELFTY